MQRVLIAIVFLSAFGAHASSEDAGHTPIEMNIGRAGATYNTTRGSTPEACAATCATDNACKAWTLTPPTFRMGPRCELKLIAGQALTRIGATSGLIEDLPEAEPIEAVSQPIPHAEPARTAAQLSADVPSNQPVTGPIPAAPVLRQRAEPPVQTPLRPLPQGTGQRIIQTRPADTIEAPSPIEENELRPQPAAPSPAQTSEATSAEPEPIRGDTHVVTQVYPPIENVPPVPPAMIARPTMAPSAEPQAAPTTPVRRSPFRPEPTQDSQRTTPALRGAPQASLTDGATPDFARLPMAPRPATGPDDRPALPKRSRTGYSVGDMEILPGDYKATAGFVDGVPDDAIVEGVPGRLDESQDEEAGSEDDTVKE